jgi:hypothetical protein
MTTPPRRFSNGIKTQIRPSASYSVELTHGWLCSHVSGAAAAFSAAISDDCCIDMACGLIEPVYLALFVISPQLTQPVMHVASLADRRFHSLDSNTLGQHPVASHSGRQ